MAIVQISKIQQRSGNIVDLPQLDEAEFGFATDAKRLFIGKVSPNENIEVLTSYSNIAFSQIEGVSGNINISALTVANGQVLSSDGVNWVNKGGAAGGLLTLGSVSNVKITGGAIGYVLETDGTGNLSWTPKGTLYTPVKALSNATPIIMTVANTVPYTNGTAVTITGADGANASTIINGKTFYMTLSGDYPTSGNVALYTDSGRTVAAAGTNLGASTPNVAIATSVVSGTGGGTGAAGGSSGTVQFNNSGILDGDADFTWNYTTNLLTVNGNANVGNLNATASITGYTITSNVATGTSPLTVTSTTRVANLNVDYANVSDYTVTSLQNTGTYYPTFVNATSGNVALGANANLSFNAATGNLKASIFHATGTITAIGNLAGANVDTAGNVTASRVISNVATGTAPLTVTSTTRVANLNVAYANVADFINVNTVSTGTFYPVLGDAISGNITEGANANLTFNAATGALSATLITGTLTTAAQPNITSTGTLTSLIVSGQLSANDIATYGTTGDAMNITGAGNTNVNGAGGLINITSASGNGTGAGGALTLTSGSANASGNAAGGAVTLTAGNSYGQGQGGTAAMYAGASANTYGALGGNIVLAGGTFDGAGGAITISAGNAAGLNHLGGNVVIKAGPSTGSSAAGKIILQTSTPGSTGNTSQTLTTRVVIDETTVNVATATDSTSKITGAVIVAGGIGVSGNVYGNLFYGNGYGITYIAGGNVTGAVGSATSATTAGTVTSAAQPNITSTGTLTALTVASGALTAITPILITQTWNNSSVAFTGIRENITDTASAAASYLLDLQVGGTSKFTVQKDGNIDGGNLIVTTGQMTTLTTGANITAGTMTGNWSLSSGSRLNATYADLAEYYSSDVDYAPGTVVEFGGDAEVTLASDGSTKVAGVVSTSPAYAMNAKCEGDYVIALALQGRVPCKVRGNIRKGDMLISGGDGYARPSSNPAIGTVIGKSLENFNGVDGVIEVAVGRI